MKIIDDLILLPDKWGLLRSILFILLIRFLER